MRFSRVLQENLFCKSGSQMSKLLYVSRALRIIWLETSSLLISNKVSNEAIRACITLSSSPSTNLSSKGVKIWLKLHSYEVFPITYATLDFSRFAAIVSRKGA